MVKIFFFYYLPQLTALENSGNNCHVVGEIRFYKQIGKFFKKIKITTINCPRK
jgi:hypothetical protein